MEMAYSQDLHLTTSTESGTNWPQEAVSYVRAWATQGLKVPEDTRFYVVWFAYILGEWKALVGSTAADGRYYEVTFDRDDHVVYMDTYKKTHNTVMEGP